MTLTTMATIANNYTDENISTTIINFFANNAISKINTTISSTLPFVDPEDAYTALDDDWIHTVVIPHICWSIKTNDSSLNEARVFEIQFERGLLELKKNKKSAIAEDYRGDKFVTSYVITPYTGM